MKDSVILEDVKKVIGFDPDFTEFDLDITMHVNSAFATLNQVGVGPEEGFSVDDGTELWSDFIEDTRLSMVKSYVFLKVKLQFDTSTATSYYINNMSDMAKEYEWRLQVASSDIKREEQEVTDAVRNNSRNY